MKKVQIVMPCINLWAKYTKPAIDSVQTAMVYAKKHGIESRLLLIDNASTDETKIEAGKYVSDVFSHKRNEERWGFQKSVNFGVEDGWERGFDYVLVCNNDILLHPQAIWRLVEGFERSNEFRIPKKQKVEAVGGETPESAPTDDSVHAGMVTAMDVRGERTPDAFSQMNPEDKADVLPAPHPNFSAFMVSKEMWDEVGEFDEVFAPAYFEDNDYHYRMQLAGWDAIVYPPALFYHFGSGTQKEGNESGQPMVSNALFENNRAFFVRKWGGMPGHETFDHPYNNPAKDWSSVQQKPAQ